MAMEQEQNWVRRPFPFLPLLSLTQEEWSQETLAVSDPASLPPTSSPPGFGGGLKPQKVGEPSPAPTPVPWVQAAAFLRQALLVPASCHI